MPLSAMACCCCVPPDVVLSGRLGVEHARIPHADRHGLIYLERAALSVEDGCQRFIAAGSDMVVAGDYRIAHQSISLVLRAQAQPSATMRCVSWPAMAQPYAG
jgi:hypothetical protein